MQTAIRRQAWSLSVVTVLAIMPVSHLSAQGYDQQLQAVCKSLSARLISQGKTTAAVVDFTDLTGHVTALGRFVAEELSGCLVSETTELQVIERLRLGAVLKEQKLGESPVIDPATAKKLGEIVGAQAIVTGTLTPFGESVRLSVRALDVATARVVAAAAADIPKTRAIEGLLVDNQNGGAERKQQADSQGTANNAVVRPLGSATGAAPVATWAQQQTLAGVVWQLMECRKEGLLVACRMMVSNRQNAGVRLRVFGWTALDNESSNTAASGPRGLAGTLAPLDLLPGATEIFSFRFPIRDGRNGTLNESATTLTSIQGQYDLGGGAQLVRFRDVPIQ